MSGCVGIRRHAKLDAISAVSKTYPYDNIALLNLHLEVGVDEKSVTSNPNKQCI